MGLADKFDAKALVEAGFEKALDVQRPAALANVNRLRRLHPDWSPTDLIKSLNRTFMGTVTTTGAAAGLTSFLPVDAPVSIPAAFADFLAFTEAAILYTLCVSEVHGLDPEDIERRRLLVTAVLLGNAGTSMLDPLIQRTGKYWAKSIVESVPMSAIKAANKVMGPRFITKYGTKQGVLVLGKQVPLGVGAVIGGGGNALFGYGILKATEKVFGPAPTTWLAPVAVARDAEGPEFGATPAY